jgi:ribosomal protein S12 methylthiotransferase accessory factor
MHLRMSCGLDPTENSKMAMQITFGEGDRVDAVYKGKTISTDQEGPLPEPFELFLASIGTCSGYYVAKFCRSRDIPTDGIRLEMRRILFPESKMIERIEIDVHLPDDFPERYRTAVVRAAKQCTVKKHLDQPPEVEVRTVVDGS